MTMNHSYILMAIAVMSVVTMALRILPFAIFDRIQTPKSVQYLGDVLPFVLMPMLIVYCLKDVNLVTGSHGMPELLAILLVVVLQWFKKNTLVSIFAGTIFYMCLIQVIFV